MTDALRVLELMAGTTATRLPRARLLRAAIILALLVASAVAAWASWSYSQSPTLVEVERLLNRRRYAPAEQAALAYLTWHPRDGRALLGLARARAARNDLAGCVAALEKVPDSSDRKVEALYRAGQASQSLGRGRDAERLYRACFARDPKGQGDALSARINLMALLAMEERREPFKALARATFEIVPEERQLPILNMLTRFDFEQTRPDINIPKLEALIHGDPQDSGAEAGLAAALDHQGDAQEARRHFARALELGPDDLELRERYLDLLHRMGDLETLQEVLAARRPAFDSRPVTQKFLGIVAEANGNVTAAEAAFRRARDLDPQEPEYHHRLSLVLFRLGQKEEATREAAIRVRQREARTALRKAWDRFADAYDLDPKQVGPDLLLGMARANEACGFVREAIDWFRQTLLKDPGNSEARNALGRLGGLDASPAQSKSSGATGR